jgi:hypothetical protein
MKFAVLAANFGGNVGDLYILERTLDFLLDAGGRDIVIHPYPPRHDPYVALRAVNGYCGQVRVSRPIIRMRGCVEELVRRSASLESLTARLYFTPLGRGLRRQWDLANNWDTSRSVVVAGGEMEVPYLLCDVHAHVRAFANAADPLLYGPISLWPLPAYPRFLVDRFSEVTEFAVRDPLTANRLSDLGITNFQLVPDMSFLGFDESHYEGRRETGRVGLCLHRSWTNRDDVRHYLDGFRQACQRQGLDLVPFSTHVREDAALIERLTRWFPDMPPALPSTPAELIELSRGLDIVASDRLHALLISMIAGALVLPIATRDKVVGYLDYMQLDQRLSGQESSAEIATTLADLSAQWSPRAASQRAFCARAKQQTHDYLSARLRARHPEISSPRELKKASSA